MSELNQSIHPRFCQAIKQLGPTRRAQADALGLTERQLYKWIVKGQIPASLRDVPPAVLRALADDKEQELQNN